VRDYLECAWFVHMNFMDSRLVICLLEHYGLFGVFGSWLCIVCVCVYCIYHLFAWILSMCTCYVCGRHNARKTREALAFFSREILNEILILFTTY